MEVFLLKNNTKKLLCILLAIAAAVCVIFACFMLTKHKQADSASSAAASVSQFGSVADFDYKAFDYSDGLDAWFQGRFMSLPLQQQNFSRAYGSQRLTLVPGR